MNAKAKIAFLELQNAALSKEVQYFEGKAIALENQVIQLSSKVSALESKVSVLLGLLQQKGVVKDSHNSSKPPSSDIGSVKKSLRPASTRKSGGQKGHKGKTLEMRSTPDKIIDLKSDFCSMCGQSLMDSTYSLESKRQVIEIPPIVPIYQEYRQYACSCPKCSHLQKADFPQGVNAPIQYGSSVIAQVSYLSVYQYVPFRRLRDIFLHLFNLPLSEGTIGNILEKASHKCEVVYAGIKQQIEQAPVVGSDETSVKVKGKNWWIWVWQSVLATFMVVSPSRASKSIEQVWQKGLEKSILISDRWAAQLKTLVKGHQICLAHLLRDLNYLIEIEKQAFAIEFKCFIMQLFSLKKELIQAQKALQTDQKQAIELEQKLNTLLLMSIDKEKYPQTHTFQSSMLKYRNYILPCLYNLEVPPDNNASERAIRNAKVKQKVSGQFKTGHHYFCVIRSVIDTLSKRNLPILPTLQQIFAL